MPDTGGSSTKINKDSNGAINIDNANGIPTLKPIDWKNGVVNTKDCVHFGAPSILNKPWPLSPDGSRRLKMVHFDERHEGDGFICNWLALGLESSDAF